MEKDSAGSRLSALDGLRGFAIILVFLNHINTTYISSFLSPYFFGWIVADGVTGVTFLFILSGFLMSYLYPNPVSPLHFLQKRYTRIFPLFLTMCSVMLTYRLFPYAAWFYFLSIITCLSLVSHMLWVYVIKKLPPLSGRILFLFFLFLQIISGAFYLLWIMRHPPLVFSQFPLPLHEGIIGIVNGTLTLPLGDYIPMLDGVYWTLIAEVLFYILYPFLFAPLAEAMSHKNRLIQIAFVLCLLPFFGGINTLSHRIAGLSILQLELFYYFVTGVTLGTIFRKNPDTIHRFSLFFSKKMTFLPVILFLFVIAVVHTTGILVPSFIGPWVRLFYALPLTALVAILLERNNLLSKIASTKVLVFIGTISYSIYLSHAIIIHMADNLYTPTNTITNILFLIVVFLADVLVASGLFYLLEKPYFMRKKTDQSKEISVKKMQTRNPKIILGSILFLSLFSLLIAYQSSLNFFSLSLPISPTDIISPHTSSNEIALLQYHSLLFRIKASEDKLGVITMKITHNKPYTPTLPQKILFSLKEENSAIEYAQSTFDMRLFDDTKAFPFGFPQIEDSKGKTYIATISLNNLKSTDSITIDKNTLAVVYPVNKVSLLRNPLRFLSFLETKLQTVFRNQEAIVILLLILPVSIFLFFM